MQLRDLVIEVRDKSLNRVGQLSPEDLVGATFIKRFNNVGSWSLNINLESRLAEAIRAPGAGIIVNGPIGVIMSGPTLSATLQQSSDNQNGTWIIEGADDSLILRERLAYPTPSTDDVTAQTQPYDNRVGNGETLLKGYVNDNIGPGSPSSRTVSTLTIPADQFRGTVTRASARFKPLQELLNNIATTSGVGYEIVQDAATLKFGVYEPQDRSNSVRMDIANNRLSRTEYAYLSPKATHVIVGGSGEAQERIFLEQTTSESVAASITWGRRIEVFKDARGSTETADLEQAAEEILILDGLTITSLSVTPTDNVTMRYGYDWNLGDQVTVVVNEIEAVAVVTEVGIRIDTDGVRIAASVGEPRALEFESKIIQGQNDHEDRIANLERTNTGFGVNTSYQPEGGTAGTQPVFGGPGITGNYNRFGNMVHFTIQVDFDNIISFGTGQYYLTLPYPAKTDYAFGDGRLHDFSGGDHYAITGEVDQGSAQMWLFSIAPNGRGIEFEQGTPITLTTDDNFHIAGTYEIEG
jgi:hypothetical protein